VTDERRPRVVLFRPSSIERDTRAKKVALTLHRAGYDVTVLSVVAVGEPLEEQSLGPVKVVPVALRTTAKDLHDLRVRVRRRRTYRPLVRMPEDEYKARITERRGRVRALEGRTATARGLIRSRSRRRRLTGLRRWPLLRLRLVLARAWQGQLRTRMEWQAHLNSWVRTTWKSYDTWRSARTLWATDRGVLPELDDLAASIGPVLDRIAPDVLHAHHPLVLPLALRSARRLRARGFDVKVVYDARENYAGIPAEEQGSVRRHEQLVKQEARTIRAVDAVTTVSEPIADELATRYQLTQRPSVVLNLPVLRPATGRSLRDELGLHDEKLVVYSGGMSRARGMEELVDAFGQLPEVHLVLVPVPHPHPMTPGLLERAEAVGARDRVHVVAPVGQDELIAFLGGADAAVHPLPGGSPNHDQAMPNKLFEYLHAGLPLVVSDAKLMAETVRAHDLGEVFVSGDASDLAEAITRALKRDRSGVEELAARFSWQGQESVVREVYSQLVPATPQPDAPFPSLEVR
jgi:glycosyltransferase involved in cell wall biosynthesis